MFAGIPDVFIGDTVCDDEKTDIFESIKIDEPTITVNFLVNNSPFAGQEHEPTKTALI